jgi:L-alanine-DL-glutamate epimerase-like enolase superfamily enzyme
METLFYDLITDRQWVDFIWQCRRIVGDDCRLMTDVGYRWKDSKEALWALRRVENAQLLFVETPLHTDDLDGLARLADSTTTPVAAGEFLQTRHEFRELMERGHCDVIQPDVGRVGGLTEALRCARMASEKGLRCIPHAWKTGLTVAATLHFGAVAPNCPCVEFFDPAFFPSLLRSELVKPDAELRSGVWTVPTTPGLGVALNEELAKSCLVEPITVVE